MCSKRDMKKFLSRLETNGFSIQSTKSGHVKITHPEMSGLAYTSSTPSDHRTIKNITATIRRQMRIAVDI